MKKIVAIAVLFIFLLNTMGYYVVFKCSQYIIKKEMFSQMRMGIFHPDVVLLKIMHPEKDRNFRRVEKNEFTYFGKLYDVVVERKVGDTIFLYCLHDKKEESLVADYTQHLRNNGNSGTSPKANPLLALLDNLITRALIQSSLSTADKQGTTFIFPESRARIKPVYLVHFAPPPKTA